MIVSSSPTGWEIYFHKAHALLAMDIGLSIDHCYWPVRKYLAAGLESIGEHDNGQPKWDAKDNLTNKETPLDYRQRTQVNLEQAKSVVRSAQYKSSFMALMVSMHCHNLYKQSDDPKVQVFLAEQKRLRKQYMDRLAFDEDVILLCYEFLRFCDDLSLALCQDELSNKGELLVDPIKGDKKISFRKLDDNSFTLDPWVFYENELIFPVEYYLTTKNNFNNDEELRLDIDLEKPLVREFVFNKSEGKSFSF